MCLAKRLPHYWILGILVVPVSGCAGPRRFLPKDYIPSEEKSYVYGRFFGDYSRAGGNIILIVRDTTTRRSKALISFPSSDPLRVVEIDPGDYTLVRYLFMGGPTARDMPITPEPFKTPFTIERGRAYYLGDFAGRVSYWVKFLTIPSSWTPDWSASPIVYQFEQTTDEFRKKYDHFVAFPCEPAFVFPREATGAQ